MYVKFFFYLADYIRTAVLTELQENILFYENIPHRMIFLVCLIGPKGVGKSAALAFLKRSEDILIDLAGGNLDLPTLSHGQRLLIDNAQLFSQDKHHFRLRGRTVIAAFSPGIYGKSHHHLQKACGDGCCIDFYFRPFQISEAKQLTESLGFTICDSDCSSYSDKRLSYDDFYKVYFETNGIARYIKSYLLHGFHHNMMYQEISKQYYQLENDEMMKHFSQTKDELNGAIVDVLATNTCEMVSPVVKMGFAYCLSTTGTSDFKLASPFFAWLALSRLGRFDASLKWQKLETLTQLLIRFTTCPFLNTDQNKRCLPKADATIHQQNIGDKCQPHEGVVTLFILAEGHNVVDFILFDNTIRMEVYFIQTSLSSYKKEKKKKMVSTIK